MHFPTDNHRSIVTYPFDFHSVRVYDKTMHPATFSVTISLSPADFTRRTPDQLEDKSEEGMQRLTFWRDTILENSVLIDINSEVFPEIVGAIDNNVMFCPALPTDHLIAELLHAKITAITKGFFDIHAISVKSTDTYGIETAFRNIDGYALPGVSYFPTEVLHPVPWWERDTIEMCEFAKGDVLEDELFNHFSDFFGKKEADIIIFRADEEDED